MSDYELGYVEYRSLAHALWKECLSVIRSWRHAKHTYGKHPQLWFGVYQPASEIRVAATGPLSRETASKIRDALREDAHA